MRNDLQNVFLQFFKVMQQALQILGIPHFSYEKNDLNFFIKLINFFFVNK